MDGRSGHCVGGHGGMEGGGAVELRGGGVRMGTEGGSTVRESEGKSGWDGYGGSEKGGCWRWLPTAMSTLWLDNEEVPRCQPHTIHPALQ